MEKKLNKQGHVENRQPPEEEAARILRDYGLNAAIQKRQTKLGNRAVDAIIKIGRPENEMLMAVEVKQRPTLGTILKGVTKGERDTLFVADFFAPDVADALRERHIPYVDLAGNAWLKAPDYLLWVQGRRLNAAVTAPRPARAFNLGGLQIGFVLLTNPEWVNLPTRKIAEMAGVANGTVGGALRALEELGYVAGNRAGKRRLRNRAKMLDKWTDGYVQRLQHALLIDRYDTPDKTKKWWTGIDHDGGRILLAGEVAAAELTQFLTPALVTIFVDGNPARFLLKNRLHQAKDGHVVLRRKFWTFDLADWKQEAIVPPLLVYADLIATNDARCIEAAARIKERYLAGLIED